MSSTTTTSSLSPYPSDLKYAIINFPLSSARTVPRTVKPLSRRVRTTHIARYPFAPETRTLDPLPTEGILFECVQEDTVIYKGDYVRISRSICMRRKYSGSMSVSVKKRIDGDIRGVRWRGLTDIRGTHRYAPEAQWGQCQAMSVSRSGLMYP